MSLPNKISDVEFVILDGVSVISRHDIIVSNLNHTWEPIFWEDRKELSIGGVKRKKNIIRGYDSRLEFDFEDVRNQETDIKTFISDLKSAMGNDYDIRFQAGTSTDYLFVIPDEIMFNQNYTNQVVRRTPTTMSFEIYKLKDTISYDGASI